MSVEGLLLFGFLLLAVNAVGCFVAWRTPIPSDPYDETDKGHLPPRPDLPDWFGP